VRLILARHGNTFDPGDPVVWTGSANDLPLVAEGERQARSFAALLHERGFVLNRILTGPLLRTKRFATIVAESLSDPPAVEINDRLTEVDYGSWTGLTNEEVEERYGAAAQNAWNDESVWPSDADWGGSPAEIVAEIRILVADLLLHAQPNDTVLLVSSNGKIRYFLELIDGAFAAHVAAKNFKVKTGAFCVLESEGTEWRVVEWNVRPQLLQK
jgi:probable phosphoglycerate mutase